MSASSMKQLQYSEKKLSVIRRVGSVNRENLRSLGLR